ncbi:MAG TPA: cyclodeaminase/cyclohydrolase family protein [Gemmatimonadales bacterium]|nr:cyclodeaminase/cyclohydrolase family protein [Gemmatimonadales bacterium]
MSTMAEFAAQVASTEPVPAGGSVAAVTGSLAAALVEMIGKVAVAKAKSESPALAQLIEQAAHLRERLLVLADEDTRAFRAVLDARRDTSGGEAERDARIRRAWRGAVQVPADVVRLSREIALLARRAAQEGPASTLGDAVMAALLAAAVGAGSHMNLRLNLEAAGRPEDMRVLANDTEVLLRDTQRAASETRLPAEERLTAKRRG